MTQINTGDADMFSCHHPDASITINKSTFYYCTIYLWNNLCPSKSGDDPPVAVPGGDPDPMPESHIRDLMVSAAGVVGFFLLLLLLGVCPPPSARAMDSPPPSGGGGREF